MTTVTDFETLIGLREYADDRAEYWSMELNKFPKGEMGLTPDAVKASPEFKMAKSNYDEAFFSLRRYNALLRTHYPKQFAKHTKAAIAARRAKA
jgi:hypothetical protein